jgi:coenzyme F420-reducing hydrogenase delta subunit
MSVTWEPKIVGFACQWCTYAGADLAGTSRLQYPATVRLIRVPCSGRVNPALVLRAFQRGADGVLVAGCHPGDCHYTSGNLFTRRRYSLVKRFLEYLGMEPERLRVEWISAAEGKRFAQVIQEMTADLKRLGPNWKMRETT